MESTSTKQAVVFLCVLAGLCPRAFGLNPSLDINQYAHKAWTVRDGFFKGSIFAIVQTPDGYLWIGTEFGLERFDGVRSVPWQPPKNEHLPGGRIRSLLAARDGRLWVGTEQGLASWKDGKLTNFPELDGAAVLSLLQDHEGTMWAAGTVADRNGRLCAIRSGGAECYGQDGSLGRFLPSLYEDHSGNLWMGSNQGVWRWRPGPPKLFPVPDSVYGLAESDAGELLIATLGGIRRLVNGRVEPYPLRGITQKFFTLRRDREGALWVGTVDSGLLHVRQDRIDRFAHSDGLSGDRIHAVFEDGEGSIWVGTSDGLDRFREVAIPTISAKQGLSNSFVNAVLAARDGTIWLGTQNGLDRWKNGEVVVYGKSHGLPDAYVSSLFQDIAGRLWVATLRGLAYLEDGRFTPVFGVAVTAIAGDGGGDLWASSLQSLVHLRSGAVVEEIPWSTLGRKDFAFALLPDPAQGGLWFGFRDGGVAYFKDHRIRASYGRADGLGEGIVRGFQRDLDGGLWAATGGGLSQIKNGHVLTLSSRNGLPCDAINWVLEDDDHFFWLYTSCGLLRIARQDLDVWVRDPRKTVQPTIFDSADGVRAISNMVATREPAKSADGKIWFLPGDGVSVIDPRHLPVNKLPPPVHIEQIIADRKAVSNLRLPALTRDLEIEYTALSLVAPEKNRFKYKLEGYDRDWVDAGNRRQAFYTNLPPRHYRFRVKASNNSGVWNETGDTLEFSIAPAYYQTTWFYASCVAAFLAMLWGLYRLRLYQIRREFNAQLDGRVDERMRVARELHDTMLQSFQAALIQMQAARNIFTRRPEKTEESLDKAINTASGAIAEGRSAIQDLRLHPAGGGDLAQLLTTAGQELARSEEAPAHPPAFGVTVEGARQELNPLLQDEVYRIARELLRNAFRHAQAGRIEVEIRYDSRQLRLHVRDDGKGIDAEVLKAGGRTGHYGLPGMRERANRFGGKLDFWSEAGAGTEAVLTVPAAAAYGASKGGAFSFLRRKLWIHER